MVGPIVWVKMNNTGKWLFYYHLWPFFANCMVIFHKTEVQTVILMCLSGQNHNWFKSFDTKHMLRQLEILAKSQIDHQTLHLINGQVMTNSGHFVPPIRKSFTKLRFRRSFWGPEQVWIIFGTTVMTQNAIKAKNKKKQRLCFFLQYCKKPEMEIFAFWVISFQSIKVYTC